MPARSKGQTTWKKMSSEEIRLAKMWYQVDGKSVPEIARLLHRSSSGVRPHVTSNRPPVPQGRPPALTKKQVDKLESTLMKMIKKADAKYEVTLSMLKKATRVKACIRTIRKYLHQRDIKWHNMRSKPVLTSADVKDRCGFADTYASKSAQWWLDHIHMHIDCKHFPIYINGKSRAHGAQQGTRGAYRKPGQGLDFPYTKASKTLKYNTGVRGVTVLAGIGAGKVLLWEYIDGRRWNGQVAAEMYKGPMLTALKSRVATTDAIYRRPCAACSNTAYFLSSSSQQHPAAASSDQQQPTVAISQQWPAAAISGQQQPAAANRHCRPCFLERMQSTTCHVPRGSVPNDASAPRKSEYPSRRSWNVLEDNDPSGYKSSKGIQAKEAVHIKSFDIPKRSPDLSVCDYALWPEVNRRMRAQEKRWAPNKKETRAQYLKRLRRTALNLPTVFIDTSIKSMQRRCSSLSDARGKHFEE